MKINPQIKTLPETKLIGHCIKMTFASNRTKELWKGFGPKRKQIKNNVGNDLYSVEIYNDPDLFKNFNPDSEFEKWAAVSVSDFDSVPDGMKTLIIPEGLYAVFPYKGKASEASDTYRYIFTEWIPNSDYDLDNRPHFALMGEKYKNEDPDSEEELWIPVIKR